jgi:hypothetical protein
MLIIQNTINISNKFYSVIVKIFVYLNNPQITKARVLILPKYKIIHFFILSMLVGISEAIRSLLTFFIKNISFKNKKLVFYSLFLSFSKDKSLLISIKYLFFTNIFVPLLQYNNFKNNYHDFNIEKSNSFNE